MSTFMPKPCVKYATASGHVVCNQRNKTMDDRKIDTANPYQWKHLDFLSIQEKGTAHHCGRSFTFPKITPENLEMWQVNRARGKN